MRPLRHLPALVRRQARGDELLDLAGIVDGRDHPVARAGQRPGAVDDLAQGGIGGRGSRRCAGSPRWSAGVALAQRRVLPPQLVGTVHPSILRPYLPGPARSRDRARLPDAVRRPESGARFKAPVRARPGRADANDDPARRIRGGNLSKNTRERHRTGAIIHTKSMLFVQ